MHSPGHFFPLPPLSQDGNVIVDEAAHFPEACTGFVEGANLVIAIFNNLHGGMMAAIFGRCYLQPIGGYMLG